MLQARKLDDAAAALAGQLDRLLLARAAAAPSSHSGHKGTTNALPGPQPAVATASTAAEPAGFDYASLGIIRGEACWHLHVDCVVLALGGAPLMALAAAVTRALLDTRLPRVSVDAAIEDADAGDIELDADTLVGVPVDASRLPAILSTCQVRAYCVIYIFSSFLAPFC